MIDNLSLLATTLVPDASLIIQTSVLPVGVISKSLDSKTRNGSCSQELSKHARSSAMISLQLMDLKEKSKIVGAMI